MTKPITWAWFLVTVDKTEGRASDEKEIIPFGDSKLFSSKY